MSDDLIAAHAENSKLMPYLHLPIQAGSDRVLRAMNRGHRAEDYLKLLARIRKARPDIALSGDFIVGFPGESEADFEDTLAVVREAEYASRLLLQIFATARNPGGGNAAAGSRRRQSRPACAAAGAAWHPAAGIQRAPAWGAKCPFSSRNPGRHPGQLVGPFTLSQSVYIDAATHAYWGHGERDHRAVGSNSLSAHIQA